MDCTGGQGVPGHDVGSNAAVRRVAHNRRSGGRRRGEKVVPRRPGDCYEEAWEEGEEEAAEDEEGRARANGAVLAVLLRGHRGRIVWRRVVGVRLTSARERVGCGLESGKTAMYVLAKTEDGRLVGEEGVAKLVTLC